MKAEFQLEARMEFREAVTWYENRDPALGTAFAAEIEASVELITQSPERWRCVEQDVRRCLVRRFPYAVLYSIETDHILILAVMHTSRKPGYWRSRQR